MIRGFYTGTTGALEHQRKMSVLSNNIANANTLGYKTERLTFQELMYQRMRMPESYGADRVTDREYADDNEQIQAERQYQNENKLRVGVGARGNESALNMRQGSAETTGYYLDVMIEGEGFFAIEGAEGNMYYTRDGAFRVSVEGDEAYLVSSSGEYVLDGEYNRIILPSATEEVAFIPSYTDILNSNEIRIGVFSCPNPYGLGRTGKNLFVTTDFSGAMSESAGTVKLMNRVQEMSNVDLGEEMVRVIESQRAFQANLTMIRTADEIEGYTNTLRG